MSKRSGRLLAVDDLSFTLEQGTITGFLGPNGAGQTTTLRMLLGLSEPSTERALVFGRRSPSVDRAAGSPRPGRHRRDPDRRRALRVHRVSTAQIGELATSASIVLHELVSESSTLEEVFLELTSRESP